MKMLSSSQNVLYLPDLIVSQNVAFRKKSFAVNKQIKDIPVFCLKIFFN